MLFDLRSGKRRRVVQVVYSLLAVSFLIGFVFFGVGTGGLGSISDIFNGNSGSGASTSQFDDQVNAAEAKLKKDPNDTQALLNVAKYEVLNGNGGVSTDPATGQISDVSSDAHAAFGRAADAWQRYLKVNKGKADAGIAAQMVNAYVILNDAEGAAQTQRIVAEQQPSANSYGTLAIFLYAGGNVSEGDAATKRAEAEAKGKAAKKQVTQQLAAYRKRAVKLAKQQAKAKKNAPKPTPQVNPLQNPLGATPTAP